MKRLVISDHARFEMERRQIPQKALGSVTGTCPDSAFVVYCEREISS